MIYGSNSTPSLVKRDNACKFWIGVVVIPWPNEAVANSVLYVKSISPFTSPGNVMLVFFPNPRLL